MAAEINPTQLAAAEIEVIAPSPLLDAEGMEQVRKLLGSTRESLVHGGSYTGRPGTWIYQNSQHLIKVRGEYRFGPRDARRWIERIAAQEQALNVHHPDKGWFLIHLDELSLIANITPLMTPLHQPGEAYSQADLCGYLEHMLGLYLQTAVNHQKRLDEGLSNFAIDANDKLYYVDDDLYAWDGFTSFAQAVGFWFRALPWFDVETAEHIGKTLGRLLEYYFQDRHTAMILAGLLRRMHMANPKQEERRTALLRGLQPPKKRTTKIKTLTQEPIALLADIHANYPALQAVLAELDQQGVRQGLVLGDVVGYGPHPRECIRELKERGFTVLKGNHDYAVAERQYKFGFSAHAKRVAEWTREQLDARDMAWLDNLPPSFNQDDWLALHGAPQDKRFFFGYVYHMTYESNLDNLASRNIHICFHGHSHITGVYYRSKHGLSDLCKDPQQSLQNYSHCLVSPGAVGQPRDNNGPAARFGIYYPKDKQLTLHQIDYDVDATANDLLACGLPTVLAQRLRDGV